MMKILTMITVHVSVNERINKRLYKPIDILK